MSLIGIGGISLTLAFIIGGAIGAYFGQRHLSRAQYQREILRISAEVAQRDFAHHEGDPRYRLPLSCNLAFYQVYFQEIDKGNTPSKSVSLALDEMRETFEICRKSDFGYYTTFDDVIKGNKDN